MPTIKTILRIHTAILLVTLCSVANGGLTSLSEPSPDLLWHSLNGNGSYITAYGGQQQHKLPYATAKARCKKKGGNLATVWTVYQNNFLQKSYATLFWVGLNCTNSSSCRWSDGRAAADKTIWLDGEPLVFNKSTGLSRKCGATLSILVKPSLPPPITFTTVVPVDSDTDQPAVIDVPPKYMTVFNCDAELGFFCDTVTKPQNATAVYQHAGGYYSMFRSPVLTHSQAEAYCSFYGGGLLIPHSWDEALTVFKLFLYQGHWIGAKGTSDGSKSSMLWEDGSTSPTRWALWERVDPVSINNINGQTTCVSYTEYTAKWYWQDCNQPLQFICQKPVAEPVHEGLVMQLGGASYYFFARPLPFQAARSVCQSIRAGADLAVIRSDQENREVACRAGMLLRGLPYYVGHRGNNHTVLNTTAMPYPDTGHREPWDSRGCMLVGWPGGGRAESSWLNANWWPVSCSANHSFVCKTGLYTPPKAGRSSSPALPPSVPPVVGPSPALNQSRDMDLGWRPIKEPPNKSSSSGCCTPGIRAAIGATGSVALVVLLLGALLVWKAARQGKPLVMPHVIYKTFIPSQDGSATSRRSCFGAPATKAAAAAAGAAAGAERAAPHGASAGQPRAQSPAQPGLPASRELPGAAQRAEVGALSALRAPNGTRQQPLTLSDAAPQPQLGFVPQIGMGSRSAAAALGAAGVDMGLQLERDVEVQWGRLLGRGTSGAVYAGQLRGLAVAVKVLLREPTDAWQAESRASSRRNSQSGPSAPMPPAAIAAAAAEALGGLQPEATGSSAESQGSQRAQGTAAALKLGNFRQEALILTHLRHPNVVALHGGCLEGQDVFLAYELMECSLADLLHARSARPLPLERVLEIVRGVACGLWQLHPHIIHCDLKSANVLLDGQGTAKISDFGVAHISTSGLPSASALAHIAGTLPYMAPERLQGQPISDKCDVYSLGVILWECLARRKPWHGLDKLSIIYQVCMERKRPEIPTDDVGGWPPEVCTLIERCWAHDLRDRPSAAELVKRLSALLARLRLGDPLRGRGAAGNASPPGASYSVVLSPALHLAPPPDGGQGAGGGGGAYSFPGPSAMDGAGRDASKKGHGGNLVDPQQLLQSDELAGSDTDSSAMFSTGSFSQPLGE